MKTYQTQKHLSKIAFNNLIADKHALRNILSKELSTVYQPIGVLGRGENGLVYECRTIENKRVAIKRVLNDPTIKSRELRILKNIESRYIIKYLASFYTPSPKPHINYLHIVMEKYPMTLQQFIKENQGSPPRIYIKLFVFQIMAGLSYLHSKGIIHRDISPQNLLVDPQTGQLKICDFGCSKFYNSKEPSTSYMFERPYRAPELIFDCTGYSMASDVWAAGCIYAELLKGSHIFTGISPIAEVYDMVRILGPPSPSTIQYYESIGGKKLRVPGQKLSSLQNEIPNAKRDEIAFLEQCFQLDPRKRITATQAMEAHCFDELFTGIAMLPNKLPMPVLDRGGYAIFRSVDFEEDSDPLDYNT